MKRLAAAALTACLLLALSGCWNRRELETLGIILAAGYDWDEAAGEYVVTAQMARPGGPGGESGAGGGVQSWHVYSARGQTVFAATRNLALVATRKIWWGHVQALIIGEAAAQRGITGVLNFIARDGETRLLYYVLVTPGTAGDLMQVQATPEKIPALGLTALMRAAGATSTSPSQRLMDVLRGFAAPSAALMARIDLKRDAAGSEYDLNGSGVFVKDRLVGYIGRRETRGALWVRGRVHSGILTVPCPGTPDRHIGVEIIHTGAKVKPELDAQGRLRMRVAIRMKGNVGDQDCPAAFNRIDVMDQVAESARSAIRSEVTGALSACRQLGADCFGFADRVSQDLPGRWARVEGRWPEVLQSLPVSLQIDASVRATGAEIRPVEAR